MTAQALTPSAAPPLDEVMLAMDVVDTLRHEQALLDAALGADARRQALIERLKSLYARQGIEVSDSVIAQGVDALAQDRFTYRPPERNLAVRLARLWIDRELWARRIVWSGGGVIALAVALFAADWGWSEYRYASHRSALIELRDAWRQEQTGRSALSVQAEALFDAAPAPWRESIGDTIDQARIRLEAAHQPLRAADQSLSTADLSRAAWSADPAAAAAGLREAGVLVAEGRAQLDAARTALARAEQIEALGSRIDALRVRIADMTLAPDAARVLADAHAAAGLALAGGSLAEAEDRLASAEQALAGIDLDYTLRIVSGRDQRSGIWRRPDGNRRARNYYLIVEAIDRDGRVLRLPVLNEETQRTERVSRFGIRVPEAVYERVRADKRDNGLIDQRDVGHKPRGALQAEWRIEIAGGTITDW
jgi:hypothetical protein